MKQHQPKETAFELYERGLRHELGNGATQDFKAAYDCFAQAALQGHTLAAWRQGLCLEWGRGTKRDLALAAKCYRAAADNGCGEAQLRIAEMLLTKRQDEEFARNWLEKAAANGQPKAIFMLGKCFENGIGGEADSEKASELYRKAADAGSVSAQKLMAERLLYGIGMQKDVAMALYWLRLAADQHDSEAQFSLGMAYLHGNDVEANATKAVTWLTKAAEAGHSQAMFELGICYANGIGVKRDLAEAAHYAGGTTKALLTECHEAMKKEAERKEAERREAERKEAERKEAERREAERREAERREAERKEAERREAERKEAERKEAERKEAERKEAERREAERKEAERKEAERKEAERKEAERKEAERREAERKEAERKAAERREAERKAVEKKEAERKEAERKEAERKEAERKEAERKEAERKVAERREAERKAAEKKEAERKATERKVAERKEAERKEAEQRKAAAESALDNSKYRHGKQLLDSGDIQGAFNAFKDGADAGEAACRCALGECYERGIGCEVDSDKASSFIRDAADAGNPRAKLLIGKYEFTMPDEENTVSEQDNFELDWVGLSMLWCQAGKFQMGSPGGWLLGSGGEKGRNDNETRHDVRLTSGFWLGKYPVTQREYAMVAPLGGLSPYPGQFRGEDLPVESVSWEDAVAWCKALTEYESAAGRIPENYAYRLPTEAEWEYACRAGVTAAFNDGSNLLRNDGICESLQTLAWFRDNSNELPHIVGQLKPNAWGFYDMHGNVSEWCLDKFAPYSSHAGNDPLGRGEDNVQRRVRRGGSWQDAAKDCRSASRNAGSLNFRRPFIGFRVALAPVMEM